MLSFDEIFSLPHPAFDEGFGFGFTPWPAPASSPALAPTPTPTPSSSPSPSPSSSPSPGLEEPHQAALSPAEERQRRRKISNRESARRSRMRKQRHLEELRSQAGRLRFENQVLADRLVATVNRCLLFHHDNDRLRGESATLRRRLSNLRRLLLLRQHHVLSAPPPLPAPVVAFPSGYEQTLASLMA